MVLAIDAKRRDGGGWEVFVAGGRTPTGRDAVEWARRAEGGPVPGWPLRLVQVLFCGVYFFAGYAKLWQSGPAWAAPENMRRYLLLLNQGLSADPASSLGYAVAAWPVTTPSKSSSSI